MGHPRARFDELTGAGGGANPQLVAHSSQLIWRVQRIRRIFADAGGRATVRSFIYALS